MTLQDLTNSIILKIEIYPISISEMWSKWTTNTGLKSFFGVENKIELKINGAFEIYFLMDAPKGNRGSEGCKILSFIPNEMLSFTWNAPPHLEARNIENPTYIVINFNQLSDNETELILSHLGWPEDERFIPVYEYFDSAWGFVLNSLKDSISETDSNNTPNN